MPSPRLANFLASGTPCIFMPTVEDVKVEKYIRKSLTELKFLDREYCIWKTTTGMLKYEKNKWTEDQLPAPVGRAVREFIDALQYVASTATTIGVFYHIKHLLKSPEVVQTIIDSAYKAKGLFSSFIFVGAYLDLPPELYNIVTYCDFPLPSKEEMENMVTDWTKEWSKDITLPKDKAAKKEIISNVANSALGLDSFSAENAAALSVSMTGELNTKIIQSQKEQQIKKSDVLEYISTDVGLTDVGGFFALKKWLHRRKEVFSDRAREYGLPWAKGILLIGLCGTGKTHFSKSIASFFDVPLLKLDVGNLMNQYVGVSESRARTALSIADAVSPCVLMVDEADKAFSGLGGSGKTDSGVTARVLSTLLTWRQETKSPVFMVFTANDPDMMPPMVYRKGRLDEVWGVDLPNASERSEIFSIHLRRRNRDPENYNLPALARAAENFSGAEIEAAIEDGMFYGFSEEVEFTTEHILRSISETTPENNVDSEDIQRVREWMKLRARPVSEEDSPEVKPVRNLSDIRKMKSQKREEKSDES
jgi:ATP-dependent 26S proteasome regulatory subunit